VRVVIDTNVLVSGLLWHGTPARLLTRAFSGQLTVLSSQVLLEELAIVLDRPKFVSKLQQSETTSQELLSIVRRNTHLVEVDTVEPVITADPDDDHVLACALAGRAEAIVSGDRHLLNLGSYRDMPILTADILLEQLEEAH